MACFAIPYCLAPSAKSPDPIALLAAILACWTFFIVLSSSSTVVTF